MRKPIIAGNWKMNGTVTEATVLTESLKQLLLHSTVPCDIVLCPPFTALTAVLELVDETTVSVGAQTMDYHDAGAFTGEISPMMLTELGVQYVIIGHSERREYFGETNETVNAKVKAALHHGLIPIVCVGESLEQRESNHTIEWIENQLEGAFKEIVGEDMANLIIAYEPIWAIGTGKTATNDQAEEVCQVIRHKIETLYDETVANAIRIQYGGSVNASNAKELLNEPNIDGALVGGASLISEDFVTIINSSMK